MSGRQSYIQDLKPEKKRLKNKDLDIMDTEMIVVGAIRMDELPKRVKRKISIMGQD